MDKCFPLPQAAKVSAEIETGTVQWLYNEGEMAPFKRAHKLQMMANTPDCKAVPICASNMTGLKLRRTSVPEGETCAMAGTRVGLLDLCRESRNTKEKVRPPPAPACAVHAKPGRFKSGRSGGSPAPNIAP